MSGRGVKRATKPPAQPSTSKDIIICRTLLLRTTSLSHGLSHLLTHLSTCILSFEPALVSLEAAKGASARSAAAAASAASASADGDNDNDDDDDDGDAKGGSKSRGEKSLGKITQKVVELLKSSPDGVVDLNQASIELDVAKRRMYDITAVLEGIGVIDKRGVNSIQWRGSDSDAQSRTQELQAEYAGYEREERELDEQLARMQRTVEGLLAPQNPDNRHVFISPADLMDVRAYRDSGLLALKAPAGALLNMMEPTVEALNAAAAARAALANGNGSASAGAGATEAGVKTESQHHLYHEEFMPYKIYVKSEHGQVEVSMQQLQSSGSGAVKAQEREVEVKLEGTEN